MVNRIHLFQLLDYLMKLSLTTNDWMPNKNTGRNSLGRVISYMVILLDTQLLIDAPKPVNTGHLFPSVLVRRL